MGFPALALVLNFLVSFAPQAFAKEFLNQSYGPHPRQIFDLWTPLQKTKKTPTPLVIYIHGGGWQAGTKDELRKNPRLIDIALKKGLAIASLEYRFLKHAPLQTIMKEDIGGFVQYIRSRASGFSLNKALIFAYGVSAGGSASLWLATHDDLANPDSPDPVKRESTRISGAGHLNAQVSYDFMVWYEFFGKEATDRFMGAQVYSRYHLHSIEDLFTAKGEQIRKDLDSYGNLSSDDPPLLLWNSLQDRSEPDYNHFVHSPDHTRILSKRAKELGIPTQTEIKADGAVLRESGVTALQFFQDLLKTR
ncbi:MAG: alpha/beta hydrolase [Bdellovibrionales bacterium]|nr:alpha/beta hydrolase [Bdellovibrionales bacterium]